MPEVIDSYNGPGELVVSDGRRYPIVCTYSVFEDPDRAKWQGSFEADAAIRSEIFEAMNARLELPDGRAGAVLITSSEGRFTGENVPPGH